MAASVVVRMDKPALDRLLESEHGDVARHLLKLAVMVERTAKHLCPVDTGRLRASITHAIAHDNLGILALVGSDVYYAIYVELGTRFMRAQSFLRTALASLRSGA